MLWKLCYGPSFDVQTNIKNNIIESMQYIKLRGFLLMWILYCIIYVFYNIYCIILIYECDEFLINNSL